MEKRKLYFQRSNGEYVLLLDNTTQDEVSVEIKRFLDQHNFKSYYTRIWEVDGRRWYDVGSHTEFFVWTKEEL